MRGRQVTILISGLAVAFSLLASAGTSAATGGANTQISVSANDSVVTDSQLEPRLPIPDPLPVVDGNPVGHLRADLLAQYPDQFGGLLWDGNKVLTVLTVGSDTSKLEDEVVSRVAELPSEYGKPDVALTADFRPVKFTLAEIGAARRDIANDWDAATASGVVAVGVDEANNRVGITYDETRDSTHQLSALTKSYPDGLVNVEAGSEPETTDGRYDDHAAWNGGDAIVRQPGGNACTSGYGVHAGNGAKFMLTAGHCNSGSWYNTDPNNPNFGSSHLVGSTFGGVITGPLDSQVIASTTSCIVWGGTSLPPFTGLIRNYITNWNDPTSGQVYMEGALGFERSSTVLQSNVTFTTTDPVFGTYTVTNGVKLSGLNVDGDSGGPIMQPSVFGPLAAGIMSSHNVANNVTYGQMMGALLWSYNVQPDLSPNGTTC